MDLAQAASQLYRTKFSFIVLTLLLIWFGHFLCIIRWKYLLAAFDIPMRTLSLLLIYGIGMFFNLVLPGLVGGDLVKTYLTGRNSRRPYSLAFASVFLDRDIGVVAMVLIAVIAALVVPVQVQGHSLLIYFLGLLALCALANLLLFHPKAHQVVLRLLPAGRFRRGVQRLEMLSEALIKVRRKPTSLVLAVVLSLVNQLLVSVSGWLIALALGIDAPFKYFFVFIPAIVVITLIPISINGVGLRELAYVSFFTIIGISREEGMLMGLLTSLVTIGS
jgi:uncharacterized protein (TIRG00374 family)